MSWPDEHRWWSHTGFRPFSVATASSFSTTANGSPASGAESKPVTVGLNNLANTSSVVKEYNVDMAAAMIAALPTLVIYVIAGKYFVRGLTAGAVKG